VLAHGPALPKKTLPPMAERNDSGPVNLMTTPF
jgi:hypothetical protein